MSTDTDATSKIEAMECADCAAPFSLTTNIMTDKPIWSYPKAKRGGCQHNGSIRVCIDGKWSVREVTR
jgi:hypothetical protein